MTSTLLQQKKPSFATNYEENWDDVEFPESGLILMNNDEKDYGLSTTTRDISGITIHDSSDDESFDKSSPTSSASSSKSTNNNSSINKVKEMMINRGVVVTNDKEEFIGLITRLVGKNDKVTVGDDWDNDMEIPEDGFANLTLTTNNKKSRSRSSTITNANDDDDNNHLNNLNKNHFEFDIWDEEEEEEEEEEVKNDNKNNSISSLRQLVIKRI